MADLTKKEQHVAHLGKTVFPMNQGYAFTSSTGMILPVYQDLLNVGESVYINSQLIARSQPLVTAAMADIHFNVDWFFVPLSMLYTLFPNTRWKTNDVISDLFINQSGNPSLVNTQYLPLCDIDATLLGTGSTASYYNEVSGIPSDGLTSEFGSARVLSFRLADMLGFNPRAALMSPQTGRVDEFNPNVFPWQALAYQAIYQNYYRDDDWERRRIDSFNVDLRYTAASVPFVGYQRGLFQLHFHRRYGDYFNVTKAQPYLSGLNLLGTSSNLPDTVSQFRGALRDYLAVTGGTYEGYSSVDPVSSEGVVGYDVRAGSVGSAEDPQFSSATKNLYSQSSVGGEQFADNFSSTASLRDMFAYEKLLRIIGMSKKDYDHQVLAHFGFRVPHDVKHELTHIFGQHSIMHIGEVVSTADTFDGNSGSALGSIGGKGYAVINRDKHDHKFTAPVDGVLMAVTYSVPEVSYIDVFDKQLSVTSSNDLFMPEFDKLGSQPLYGYEVNPFGNGGSYLILGWQHRYLQWKMKYNKASFAFYQNNTSHAVNTYSPWILTARPLRESYQVGVDPSSLSYRNFLCDGSDINNIMQVPYTSAWSDDYVQSPWLIYQTDPFIEVFKASVKKVSTMSPYGDPDLNGI